MDAIDNLVYATLNSALNGNRPIDSDFYVDVNTSFGTFSPVNSGNNTSVFSDNWTFRTVDKEAYCSYPDNEVIESSITRHWYDINGRGLGTAAGFQYLWGADVLSDFQSSSTYHLFYAYLLENTRILQIFERVIDKYFQDEEFGVIPTNQASVYNWLINSESLFFKEHGPKSYTVRSLIRPLYDANRRNAYNRMFGIDLAFGNLNSAAGESFPYYKAKTANHQFIPLFERYLSEVWQGYTNARNTSGANSTDVNHAVDIAIEIQELLRARRGGSPNPTQNGTLVNDTYANTNLSREEFSAVILLSWFAFIISYDSEVVRFLNCQSSTVGERLMKIGAKVGIPAHSKCQSIFDMAGAASQVLTRLESGGSFDNSGWVQTMLSSLNPPTSGPFIPTVYSDYMNYFLTLINNWEKATGHKIKNPEANIRSTVSITQPQRTNGKLVPTS